MTHGTTRYMRFRPKAAASNGLVEKFKAFTQGIVDQLNELGFSFSDIGEVIKAVWDGLCSILAPMFEGAFQQIANVLSYAMDLILNIVDIFVGIFTGDWDQALSGINCNFRAIDLKLMFKVSKGFGILVLSVAESDPY